MGVSGSGGRGSTHGDVPSAARPDRVTGASGPDTRDPTSADGPDTRDPTSADGPDTRDPTSADGPDTRDPTGADGPERCLEPEARAALVTLARSLDVFDPAAGRRAALRASLAETIGRRADLGARELVDAIGASLVAEIAIVLTHSRPVGAADVVPDPAGAVLAATTLEPLPGLAGVARAVRHQYERWDGSGGPHGLRGPDIPVAARLVAVTSALVGLPDPETAPSWAGRRRRLAELAGRALDPDLVEHALAVTADGPPFEGEPSLGAVCEGLERFVPVRRDSPVEALVAIGAAVRAADSIPDVLVVIAEQARRALGAATVSIGRLDHETRRVEILVNVGDLAPDEERFPADERLDVADRPDLARLFEGHGGVETVDEGRADDPVVADLRRRGLRSEALWPILIGDTVWGVVLARTPAEGRSLDHDDLATLRLVATHVAAAVAQAARRAEFEQLALRDPLTGLGNRRVLDQVLDEVFRRPPVERRDVALVMCDVDGLKVVNDTLGHAAGDELLVEAARALVEAASEVRGSTVCRIGGDEFCIILDGGGMLSAHPVAQRAEELFARTGRGRSLSSGVALVEPDMRSPSELLRAADLAQYEQKRRRKGLPPAGTLPETPADRRRTRPR